MAVFCSRTSLFFSTHASSSACLLLAARLNALDLVTISFTLVLKPSEFHSQVSYFPHADLSWWSQAKFFVCQENELQQQLALLSLLFPFVLFPCNFM